MYYIEMSGRGIFNKECLNHPIPKEAPFDLVCPQII